MPEIDTLLFRFRSDFAAIAAEGGWVFWCLLFLAFVISFALINLSDAMRFRSVGGLGPREWSRLLSSKGRDASLVARVRQVIGATGHRGMDELEEWLFARARRRLPFAFVLIGTAPLVGLLGTVSGMMSTFRGMSASTRSAPIEIISRGISEALITTQTGLIIAVPAFVICSLLRARLERCQIRFRQLEVEITRGTA